MNPSRPLRTVFAAAAFGLLALNAHSALFDDDEARKAILDLRQKVDAQQLRNVEELKKANTRATDQATGHVESGSRERC